jgi:hypothetical protein
MDKVKVGQEVMVPSGAHAVVMTQGYICDFATVLTDNEETQTYPVSDLQPWPGAAIW